MLIPKSENNSLGAKDRGGEGANHLSNLSLPINTQILLIGKYLTTPLSKIRKHIPAKRGVSSSHCFRVLVMVLAYPRLTVYGISDLLHTRSKNVKNGLEYLLQLGYVKSVGTPRLILTMDKYTIDTCYIITPLGRSVIIKLLY